jgi:hypothetical protein
VQLVVAEEAKIEASARLETGNHILRISVLLQEMANVQLPMKFVLTFFKQLCKRVKERRPAKVWSQVQRYQLASRNLNLLIVLGKSSHSYRAENRSVRGLRAIIPANLTS